MCKAKAWISNNAIALDAAMTRDFHFLYLCRRASEWHRSAAHGLVLKRNKTNVDSAR
jgi:hypothetical protein